MRFIDLFRKVGSHQNWCKQRNLGNIARNRNELNTLNRYGANTTRRAGTGVELASVDVQYSSIIHSALYLWSITADGATNISVLSCPLYCTELHAANNILGPSTSSRLSFNRCVSSNVLGPRTWSYHGAFVAFTIPAGLRRRPLIWISCVPVYILWLAVYMQSNSCSGYTAECGPGLAKMTYISNRYSNSPLGHFVGIDRLFRRLLGLAV